MTTVQLAVLNKSYANSMQTLLVADGEHNVTVLKKPALKLPGVIVSEAALLGDLSNSTEASRFVVIAHPGTDDLSRLWQAGFPTVVSDRDSATVVYLAILATELRLNARRASGPGIRTAKGKETRMRLRRRVFRRDEALRLRSEGASWRDIARALGLPMSTVIDACRSENPPCH